MGLEGINEVDATVPTLAAASDALLANPSAPVSVLMSAVDASYSFFISPYAVLAASSFRLASAALSAALAVEPLDALSEARTSV